MDPNQLAQLIDFAVFRSTTDSLDVLRMASIDAALKSARYYQEHMLTAKNLPSGIDHLTFALSKAAPSGMILEFGVATGRTLNHIAGLRSQQPVYGFDVFSGLPEDWRTDFEAGAFAQRPPAVRENCQLVVGLFERTLPSFIAAHGTDIAFLHVDCDLYGGTRTILENCRPHIKPGTVIVFDEYFNYPGFEQHEFRAWAEFTATHGISYKYLGFVSSHQQVSVMVL